MKILEDIKNPLPDHQVDFNQTGCNASLGERESSLFKCGPFPRGDNSENTFLFFSRITGPISTKLSTSTKHRLVIQKRIQASINEGPHPFPRRDNSEIVKIHNLQYDTNKYS